MKGAAQNSKAIKIRTPFSTALFNTIGAALLLMLAVFCVAPFVLLISASFTSEQSIIWDGYRLIPREFSVRAYNILFRNPKVILDAYGVSSLVTAAGTVGGLLMTSAAAYVLSRPYFKYRGQFSFFFYFTTLFNGGMLSSYIFFVRYYNLKNTYWALILPTLIHVFYLLIMRTFMAAIPESICESAKIDGASEFVIFFRLILPLSTASLATIGLFLALDYWNNWYNAMLYISKINMYPLQYMLYNMMTAADAIARL
jgi:putative aldouronate transport system permease protein